MDLNNDLRLIYAAWPAIPVLWVPRSGQGCNGRAIHIQPGMALLGGEVLATDHSLRYPSSTFPNVRQGDSFIIDELTYKARENAQPVDDSDGLEQIVPLIRPGS